MFHSHKTQQIQKNKYPVEIHEIYTDDGYILHAQRIPPGKNAPPVLILHGIGSSSTPYTLLSNGLPYALADEGYDVWLGSFRCSFENTRHVKYSQSQSIYWDFGIDEMALHDTPALIDHILQTTNQTQLSIISMSMSTITTTAMLAFKPEFNNKVSKHVALAPIVHLEYIVSAIPYKLIQEFYHITRFKDSTLSAVNKVAFYLAPIACSPFTLMPLCQAVQLLLGGYSPGSYGFCVAGVITSILRGVSIKTVKHFYQIITKKQLMQFDYGVEENLARYGTELPPTPDFSKITTPTSLIYSANDPVASPLNVALQARAMKSAKVVLLEDTMINHVDFIAAALDQNIMERLNHVILEKIRSP